jgi:hypothetical protein
MEPENLTDFTKKFVCDACHISCSRKREWERHVLTAKHKNRTSGSNLEHKITAKKEYKCHCGKIYNSHSGLWKHSKTCEAKNKVISSSSSSAEIPLNVLINDNQLFKEFIIEVVKNNSELQKQNQELQMKMMEMFSINNSTVNSHSHNKTFNMQFFLNEQCKDAMNIMEFVDTFKLDFADLEKVGEVGYVECMSNLIIQKLNGMDIYKRPIHCSDARREIMYVKDKNVWEKENGTHDRLRLAIRYIGKKNTDLLIAWCEAHPGSCDSDNILNDIYMEMVMQSMGGRGDREENENKIMRKIGRSCLIDKHF